KTPDASGDWSSVSFRSRRPIRHCVRVFLIPGGPNRRDRLPYHRPAPCRRGTARQTAANWQAARQTTPRLPRRYASRTYTLRLTPHVLRITPVNEAVQHAKRKVSDIVASPDSRPKRPKTGEK